MRPGLLVGVLGGNYEKRGVDVEITQVKIKLVDMNKVKAIASITFDDEFVVHDLRVVDGDAGLFIAMPSRKLPNDVFRDIAHPLNTETRNKIQSAVVDEYSRVISCSELAGDEATYDVSNNTEVIRG